MTYFGFLRCFLFLPILIFLAITFQDNKRGNQIHEFQNGGAVWAAIGVHILLAVIYTTPWDNYLVATSVWYYNPKLVTGFLIGYVPIEEYTFFVVETVFAGLWWWCLARWLAIPQKAFKPNALPVYLSAGLVTFLWLIFTYLLFFGGARWTYLSITLFWALPPVILQLLFGADILWHYRELVAWAILVPGAYLSLIDIIALRETTWSISPAQTTGIIFFGILPLEEVVFFFITNVLITFGITLLLANVTQARFAGIKKQVQRWKEKRTLHPQSR